MSSRKDYSCSLCGAPHHVRRTCTKRGPGVDSRRLVAVMRTCGTALQSLEPQDRAKCMAALNELYGGKS